MNAIQEFNRLLNQSVDNRFENWKTYRDEITDFILNSIPKSVSSILVIGCGNADDINLSLIANRTSKLTLLDIDETSIKRAFEKYKLDMKSTNLLPYDVTGMSKNKLWNGFVNEMIKISTKHEISLFFDKLKSSITAYSFQKIHNEFDVIIISPIYTQLLFQQGLSYISILNNLNYPLLLLETIRQELLDLMPVVIEQFNQNIVKLTKKGTKIIVLSDIFEALHDSDFYRQIKAAKNLDLFHQTYVKTYGVGLGDYGLYNIQDKLETLDHKWLEWPFNSQKSLFVKILSLKN